MERSSFPWFWLLVAAILLLIPGTAGRLLIDVLGGLTLLLLLLPVLAAGIGFIAWQVIRRRLTTCQNCGTASFGADVCPACGAPVSNPANAPGWVQTGSELDPSQVTINVEAVDVMPSTNGDAPPSP